MSDFIMWLDNLIWSTPLIILTFGSALIFCFAMKFGNITKIPLQWKLLRSGSGSMEGLSPLKRSVPLLPTVLPSATSAVSW